MAKRTKSGDGSGLVKCDQYLSACPFEEETWSPCVAWIVGRRLEDFKHIEALNTIVQTGLRKLFSVITKEQLCIDVRELGDPKNKKAKDIPPYSEVCEACKVYLDAGEPVPTPLMAKLIKWKMLLVKDADLRRQAAENKKFQPPEESASEKKKGKEKDTVKERVKSPKKVDKKSTEGQHAKEGSKMKKRGEDDDEHKYIDDEPEDGAQRYFIVTGFHDPYLFQFLEAINVNVNCIISVTSQEFFKLEEEATVVDEKMESLRQELKVFWTDILPLLQCQPDSSTLHDIARLDYEVSYLAVPNEPQDTEQRVNYSTGIFEDIALMLYNLIDAKRLYYTYLANLKLINIPPTAHKEHSDLNQLSENHESEKSLLQNVDMRYYNDLMNTVPNESVSVALIMHCMLEQVVATEKGIDPPSELAVAAKSNGINMGLSAYFEEMTAKLGLTSHEHELLAEHVDIQPATKEKSESPKIINFNDEICFRTHHLKPNYGFNAEEVERKMLQLLPISKYCQVSKLSSAEKRKRASRFHELFHQCALQGLSKAEVEHALNQFVFECMELTKCDRNGFPLQMAKEGLPEQYIPWDDPYPYFKFLVPESEKNIPEELPSPGGSVLDRDERDEEMAAFPHQGHSISSSVDRPKLPKFSEAQRISEVIMEMVVTLDRDACSAIEKTNHKIEITKASHSSELKKGIMIHTVGSMAGSVHSRYSVSNSVRFDVPSPKELEDLCQDVIGLKEIKQSLLEITETQQRTLDDWCFVENYKPGVFLQVLQEAIYSHPYIEVYQANRDQTIMLVLHSPHNRERQYNSNWHSELHSNTGFRNYLEYTVESIQTWLKMKEAEYKAAQMSKEAANLQKDEEEKQKQMEKADKKGKRSPQRSGKSRSPGISSSSSFEGQSNTFGNPYIRQGSMKAMQQEQLRLAAEEEEKEKMKSARKSRSAQKLKEKQDKEKEKPDKTRKSTGGKMNQNKQDSDTTSEPGSILQTDLKMETQTQNEESPLPFFGYDTGNHFIHLLGATSTLFPSDGGTIQTERTEIVQGSITVKSVVKKDGHIFVVHIVNPREDMNLPEKYAAELDATNGGIEVPFPTSAVSEKEISRDEGFNLATPASNTDFFTNEQLFDFKKTAEVRGRSKRYAVSQFGSVTAHLSDGMILAISQFGPTGESYLQPYQPPAYIQPAEVETQLQTISTSPTRSKTKGIAVPEAEKEKSKYIEETIYEVPDTPKPQTTSAQKQEFQELHVTCPDGLSVKYLLQSSAGVATDSADSQHLMVKQSYPFKTRGLQSCESARNKYIQSEVSRVITADGNVIKNMVDGSVEVLSSDGTVSIYTGSWSYGRYSSTPGPKHRGRKKHKSRLHPDGSYRSSKNPNWTITYPNGERLQIFKGTADIVELSSLPVCVACDPETKQIMCSRDDHVIVITYPDGGTVVEHADGTRISTYYKDITVLDEAEVPSPRNYEQTMKFIKVECPAFATVEFNTATSENLTVFGNGTTINVFPDGYYMFHHSKGGRIEIDTEGTMTYFPQRSRFLEHLNSDFDLQYIIRHNADIIVETIDPNGNIFNVRSSGESFTSPAITEDLFSSISIPKQEEGEKVSRDNHAPRFFIIREDCSGTELLRYEDVAEYLFLADQNPAAAVLTEEIPNLPGVKSITILKPYLSGVSERWFKKYDQDCIVPQGLRCRDLKTIQPKEYKKPGPVFGTNVGKGLSIGTNVKFPAKIPILKCPEKLELRQLLQFPPVTDEMRQKLIHALHDFAANVLARMQADNLMSIEDPRSQEEKLLAHELNMFSYSLKQAASKYESDDLRTIYEEAIAPPPPCPPSKPPPRRALPSFEQSQIDKADEEARRILRKKIFEPYFESELGKVFIDKLARGLVDDTHNKSMDSGTGGTDKYAVYGSDYEAYRDSPGTSTQNQNVPGRHQKRTLSYSAQILADLKRSNSQNMSVHKVYANRAAAEKPFSDDTSDATERKSGLADHLAEENQSLVTPNAMTSNKLAGEIQLSQPHHTGPLSHKPGLADHLAEENQSLVTPNAMTSNKVAGEIQLSQPHHTGPLSHKPGLADHLAEENQSLVTPNAMTSNEVTGEIQLSQPHHTGPLSHKPGLADHLAKENQSLVTHDAMTSNKVAGKIQLSQPHYTGPLSHKSAMKKNLMPSKNITSKKPATKNETYQAHLKKNQMPSNNITSQQPAVMVSRVESCEEDPFCAFVRSLKTDIYGNPRSKGDVFPPFAIQGGKPGAHPNLKYSEIEDPVRMKIRTASIAGATIKSIKQLARMRGLIVYPKKVDFGTLIEGHLYSYVVNLRNTGIDTCRFKVRKPPSSSGLTVKTSVGSVAAGLSADLNLELYAIATEKDSNGIGSYSYTLQIVTETDDLELPIVANVISDEQFNNPDFKHNISRTASVEIMGKRKPQQLNKNTAVAS